MTFARIIDQNGEVWDVSNFLNDLSRYSGSQLLMIDSESYNTQIGNINYTNCEQFFKLTVVLYPSHIRMNIYDHQKSTENRYIIHSEEIHDGAVDPELLWQQVIQKLIENGDARLAIISSVRKGGSAV